MVSTYTRMHAVNQILKAELRKKGYYDIVLFPHTRWFKDVYGIWDGVCKKKCSIGFRLIWLQLKTGYASRKDKAVMKNFCEFGHTKGLLAEYVPVRVKYKKKKGSFTKRKVLITEF